MSARRSRSPAAVGLWTLALVIAAVVLMRTPFVADMSVFLPRDPSPLQRLLVQNLDSGVLTRLILVGIDQVPADSRGAFSRGFADRLRADPAFDSVNNGDAEALAADQRFVFERRYLLSPTVDAAHFSTPALRAALEQAILDLSSSQGALMKSLVTRDPTGEVMRLTARLGEGASLRTEDGVWVSHDGSRLNLMVITRATGQDLDAQAAALDAIQAAFEATRAATPAAAQARLSLSGPPVFAVDSRAQITRDVHRLSLLGGGLILALLAWALRSPVAIALACLPLVAAILIGAGASALAFGSLHGLTLGFGITLIGEAVDFALYQLLRGRALQGPAHRAFWRTIILGVATSVVGFGTLALSSFPGLTQMATFSVAGLLAAVLTTRWVLPALAPAHLKVRDLMPLEARLRAGVGPARRLRGPMAILMVVAGVAVALGHHRLWDDDLAALSPISAARQQLDADLREAVAAPDLGLLVIAPGTSQEEALRRAESASAVLDRWVADQRLAGYSSPTQFLPSEQTQAARRAALPPPDELRARLRAAAEGLILRADRLEPFVEAVAAAREAPLIPRSELKGSQAGLQVDALLTGRDGAFSAALPLRPMPDHRPDLIALGAELARQDPALHVLDLKHETDRLYAGYLDQAIRLALGGGLAIVVLVAVVLRRPGDIIRVCAPLLGAVLLTLFVFLLIGARLNLLHLIGLMLVMAVGSNYTLFFRDLREDAGPTLASLALANVATVIGFGVLAGSQAPVLSALGGTVALGAVFAMLLAYVWAPTAPPAVAGRVPSGATAGPAPPQAAGGLVP